MTERRTFQRPLGEKRYKKLFIISAEGYKTEPLYFGIFNNERAVVRVSCLKTKHHSSPPHVLKRMTDSLKVSGLKSSDEAWLVVDRDNWSEEQLLQLHQWSLEKENYGLALSNPKFEYWLLLHYEDGAGITSSNDCTTRLKHWMPGYDKGLDTRKINPTQISDAIRRAKKRDQPACLDWPRDLGQTTVYRLIEKILNAHIDQTN